MLNPGKPRNRKSSRKKKLQPPASRPIPKAYQLQPGDRFRMHPDCIAPGEPTLTFEVLRVNQGSATCRSLTKTAHTIRTLDGKEINILSSGRPFHISPTASVILLPDGSRGLGLASPTPTAEPQP